MSIRLQLLLVSLLTLVLPWAGCQYVREMENALRESHTDALMTNAIAISERLQLQPALFKRADAEATGSLYAFPLRSGGRLDGYMDDWSLPDSALQAINRDEISIFYGFGMDSRFAWLFVDVRDEDVVYDGTDQRGETLLLRFDDPDGAQQSYVFSTLAPGQIYAMRPRPDGSRETRIQGEWQPTPNGYNLEIRIPRSMLGDRLGFWLANAGEDPVTIGTLSGPGAQPGQIIEPIAELAEVLNPYLRPGWVIRVGDVNGWELARVGEIGSQPVRRLEDASDWVTRFYQLLLGTRGLDRSPDYIAGSLPESVTASSLAGRMEGTWMLFPEGDRAIAAVSAPFHVDGEVAGTVLIETASDAILTLTRDALRRLMNLTLLATGLATLGLLGMATLLAIRIRRLRNAAEAAVSPDGRILADMPYTRAGDELGDLSRSFSGLLDRLQGYHRYLETLASKLSHELRTPLTIVQSSLENLEHEELGDTAKQYTRRAVDGTERLKALLKAMSEASRVEASIKAAHTETFDLAKWVREMTTAYRGAFPGIEIQGAAPENACLFEGSPELLAQMLDKLVDNAADFAGQGGRIGIALRESDDSYMIEVSNTGPSLPEDMRGQLFDSMVSQRTAKGDTPHLGLGLFIVRLIAEFHGGVASADNLPDASGVAFRIALPTV